MKTVKGAKKRIPDIKRLWLEAFPEDSEFVDVFLRDFYKPSKTLLRYDGDTLVSMLFWMDVKLTIKRRAFKGAYLYGVATALSERNAGHFTALHSQFIDELRAKKYKFALTVPASDSLFSLYKRLGYPSTMLKTEYAISTLDFDEISAEEAWERRLAEYKKSTRGIRLLETREMFLESVREHRFLGFDGGYFAFCKKDGRYVMYDVCDAEDCAPPYELEHYERSAVVFDLADTIDTEFWEKEKPVLSFLMN